MGSIPSFARSCRGPLCAGLLACGMLSPLFAGFSQNSPSVVAYGMAGAFTARADDASALFINPAGLAQLKKGEVSFMYGIPFLGMPDVSIRENYLAAAVPLDRDWTLALGGSSVDVDGRLQEQEGIVGAAYRALPWLAAGLNISYLYHNYQVAADDPAKDDPVFAGGTSKGALGIDAGLLARLWPSMTAALSVRHANRPDVGLADEDVVPLELRGGLGMKTGRFRFEGDVKFRDAGANVADGRRTTWSLGAEGMAVRPAKDGTASPALALRAGLNEDQLAAGFGFGWGDIRFDYAFTFVEKLSSDNSGSHRAALSCRFGRSR